MDDLLDFFNPKKKIERRPIIAGGRVNTFVEKEVISRPIPEDNRSYAEKFQDHEIRTMRHVKDEESFMDADEGDESVIENSEVDDRGNLNLGIYSKYKFEVKNTKRLPIQVYRKEILGTIAENPVVVIEGPTGCGKTTQVPQYIMEDAFAKKKYFNIVVTQPRRLAAVSVAKRVAQERDWVLGEVVGFQIGRKKEISEDTRINFCTTGVLLEKLVKSQSLNEYTHIILDEVHERDIDMDFLLIVIRKMFFRTQNPVKIIMMSATIKSEKFADYFTINESVPVINLTQASPYVVKEYFIDDIKKIGFNQAVISDGPEISAEMYCFAARLILGLDNLEKREAQESEEGGSSRNATRNSVLVFLPGINEINQLHKELDKLTDQEGGFRCEVIPLHSSLTQEEQQRVFKYFTSARKVILSTNIAESSITVPDIKYVVDFCLTKNLRVDTTTNFSSLQMEWASLDNCIQRSGRAGRVMDGRVYRLVTKQFYRSSLPRHITPEMQRQSLESVVLKSKLIDMGAPETVLGLAMDPPLKSDIHNAILQLKELGGLLNTVNGEFVLNDGDMTFIGKVMAQLPVDIRVSRLIVLGHTFSVVDEAVIIGAALSVQGVFSEHYNREMMTYSTKLAWANGTGSDLIALLTAYKVYQERVRQNQREFDNRWAERCGIQLRMMHEVVELVQELNHRLAYFNIQPIPAPYSGVMNEYERCIILKVVFAGAFYPNFAVYGDNDAESEKETFRITNGRNPCNTVILQGLPSKHIGQLYRKSIREMFWSFLERSTKIDVSFDQSERVYVTFTPTRSDIDSQLGAYLTEYQDNHDVSGNVLVEVYKAVKFGQLNRGLKLNVLNQGKAQGYAVDQNVLEQNFGESRWKKYDKMNRDYVVYPRKNYIEGKLTHFVHLHKFYILPREEAQDEDRIRTLLNNSVNLENVRKEQLKVGMMVAAQRQFGSNLYYCRALVVDNDFSQPQRVEVFFIDFGNTANLSIACIQIIRSGLRANDCPVEELPPRAIECRLACIAPTAISAIRGRWTEETIRRFTNKIPINSKVKADVYAFVDGIAYVTLNHGGENLNEWAIKTKLAQYSDENYMVKFDHDRRMTCELLKHPYILDDVQIDAMVKPQEAEVDPPPENICDKQLSLRGPTSPLSARLFSLTKSASKKNCRVEKNSVNSVLLDNNFQEYHQKMLVATHIKKSGSGDLLLYQTTIMPNIPGLVALLALIFCPTAEFCRDSDNSRFISVLTGLGSKPGTKIPMFEEHDMQIPLDIKLDHDDIECINQLRYSMSSLLLLRNGQDVPVLENHARYKLQQKIKDLTLNILTRSRPLCERKFPPKPFVWNQCEVKPTELLQISDLHNGASIFPFLTSLKLDPMATEEMYEGLKKSCKDLYEVISINRIPKGGIKCLLCDAYLNDVTQVRLHVFTKLHQDRETEIGYIQQRH